MQDGSPFIIKVEVSCYYTRSQPTEKGDRLLSATIETLPIPIAQT